MYSLLASAMLQCKDKSFMSQTTDLPIDDNLSNVLSQWNFETVAVSRDGNCLFTSVSVGILQLAQQPNCQPMLNSLARIGITNDNLNIADISRLLRRLMVVEWLGDNSDYYQKFVSFDIRDRATTFLNQGQFAGDLGDLMIVTLSNILYIPIVIFTSNPGLPVICITRTTCIESVEPLYLAYIHQEAGHYDYVVHISKDKNKDCSSPSKQKITRCYCGRKKGFMGTPCTSDVIGNCRCHCARKGEPCKEICKCKDCLNRNGQKPPVVMTRVREPFKYQEQPLCGRRGSDFLKVVQEEESVGSMSKLERLIVFAIFVNFMLRGYESTPDSIHRAFLDVWVVASECPFIEIPIFKRSQQYISRYLLRVRNIMSLFFELHGSHDHSI